MGLNPEPNLIMHEVEFFLCVVTIIVGFVVFVEPRG